MQEWIVERLRSAFRSPDATWPADLDRLAGEAGPDGAARLHVFLTGRLDGAAEAHRRRLLDMLAHLETRLAASPPGDALVEEIAERIEAVAAQASGLEELLREEKAVLATLLGAGTKRRAGSFEVRIGEPRPSLRILDAEQVPEAFRTPQPDRKRILDHFTRTGEILPGVDVRDNRPPVTVRRSAQDAGGP